MRGITLACGIAGLLMVGCGGVGRLRAGEPQPPFSIEAWDGGTISPATLAGRPACFDFWASWCPACAPALPALDAIARRHPEVTVVAINIDARRADAERSIAQRLPDRHLTLARDPDGELFLRLGADSMPFLYVVDREGVVRLIKSGFGIEQLDAVERLLSELEAPAAGR